MRPVVRFSLLILGLAIVGLVEARAHAEPSALVAAYGNGVHAYHAGEYQCSYDELSSVIEAGSLDPRAHYFRGLAALKLGRLDEADADFQMGANLEAEGRSGISSHSVSLALERVQGCDRLKLEDFRRRVRVAAMQRDREAIRRRYSDIGEAEADVLRRRRPERIEPAEPVPTPRPGSGRVEAAAEPAEEAEKLPTEPAAPEEPVEKPTDTANPFADDPA